MAGSFFSKINQEFVWKAISFCEVMGNLPLKATCVLAGNQGGDIAKFTDHCALQQLVNYESDNLTSRIAASFS